MTRNQILQKEESMSVNKIFLLNLGGFVLTSIKALKKWWILGNLH